MSRIAVITGDGGGVVREAAAGFARNGCSVASPSRNPDRLEHAAAELRQFVVRAPAVPNVVADAEAVQTAAGRVEQGLGPTGVWVSLAMAPCPRR